jgi:predicted transcriptional regulator
MKTAILPQVRVEPQLRADLESVLREGETLSEFVETTVRSAVEHRRVQKEFHSRADAAWAHFQQTGEAYPAQDVVAELRAKVDAKRRHLQGKHRPAAE